MQSYRTSEGYLFINATNINKIKNILLEVRSEDIIHTLCCRGLNLNVMIREFFYFPELKSINFLYNDLIEIPSEISKLTNLESCYFGYNKIKTIPIEITNLNNLKELNLSYNYISELPVEIFKLTNIKTLNLQHNKLAKIPREIQFLTNLEHFNCSHNYLTRLPNKITDILGLKSLLLENNNLISLPRGIEKLINLYHFDISNNKLNSIPNILYSNSIEFFNYSGNPINQKPNIHLDNFKINECNVCKTFSNVERLDSEYLCVDCKPNDFTSKQTPTYYIGNKKIFSYGMICDLHNRRKDVRFTSYELIRNNNIATFSCPICGPSYDDTQFIWNSELKNWELYWNSNKHENCEFCEKYKHITPKDLVNSIFKVVDNLKFIFKWTYERVKETPYAIDTFRPVSKTAKNGRFRQIENEYREILSKVSEDLGLTHYNFLAISNCIFKITEDKNFRSYICHNLLI